jgi:hypothetical protein
MPTPKTECTELSVGFGILNANPLDVTSEQIPILFCGSLPNDKFARYLQEYRSQTRLYDRFINVGRLLRTQYPSFANISQLVWTGPQQQAATTTASKDLFVANVQVSVKNQSNVVNNLSPYNLFVTIPNGSIPASHAENWYEMADPEGIQYLYQFVQETSGFDIPQNFSDFDSLANAQDRDAIQDFIASLTGENRQEFKLRYERMCKNVSEVSANRFNQLFSASKNSILRSSVFENIIKQFFRINGVPYLLVGLDNNQPFGLQIPDITQWKKDWKIHSLTASPDLTKKQSVANFRMVIENRHTNIRYNYDFHAEIRWSHGKFCGNPESKLYKNFTWSSVSFFSSII